MSDRGYTRTATADGECVGTVAWSLRPNSAAVVVIDAVAGYRSLVAPAVGLSVAVVPIDERPEVGPTGPTEQDPEPALLVEDVDRGVDVAGVDGGATAPAVVGTTDHTDGRSAIDKR